MYDSKFNDIMKSAGEKLNFARATLQGVDKSIRDDQGFSYTANRILSATENLMDNLPGNARMVNEAFADGMNRYFSRSKNNFSATDLQSVYDMDVVDISIAATVASHGLTYVAMERAMHSVRQNIEFQKLVAVTNAGGFKKGDTVVDPRLAIAAKVKLGREGAKKDAADDPALSALLTGTEAELHIGYPLIAGTTEILWDDDASGPMGFKPVAFSSTALKPKGGIETVLTTDGTKVTSAEVDLAEGIITIHTAQDMTGKIKVLYCIDRIAEKDGDNTLKLRPQLDSKEIVATENRVILQTSVEVQAQMNKIYRENSQYGVDVDYGKRAIDQVVMLYTYYIDLNVIRALWEGVKDAEFDYTLQISGYYDSYSTFAATKNDRIAHFVRQLCSAMLSKTGLPLTALVVDELGALTLASDAENFKDEPAFRQRRDGLVGYYNNIPVVRNIFLNDCVDHVGEGLVLGVHKSLNGEAAPVAFGEYLSPYSTIAAVNPMNPGELSQALFSQTATECVVPEFVVKGLIITVAES